MADEVASLLVRITADGSQAVGVLNGIQATVGTLADSNATTMSKIAASGALASKVGMTITKTFGVATVAGLTASAKAAGQLNKELANIGTLSVPTERLKEFKGQIQDIAIATGKSTSDISEGTYQVISAFGDSADTMEKVEINAKAAMAGLATTADSINLTSAVTKAYGDTSAAATQKVADLAFKTVELGQTTFPELASSVQQVTSLSKELGVSQEELFGTYATLTGVTGNAAEVQTQLKAVYTALLKPSENMTKAIKKQGYESGYSMIKTLGFAGTLDALKKATNGSEEEMLGLFNNVRAMPAVMALTGAQYDTFNTKLEKMKNAAGAASDAFEVQTEGIAKTGFTLEQAKVKMQVAAQKFGESAAPIIGDFADVVDKVSDKLANMSDEERKAIINTGVLTTKAAVGLTVFGKVATAGTKVVGTVKSIAGAISQVGEVKKIADTARKVREIKKIADSMETASVAAEAGLSSVIAPAAVLVGVYEAYKLIAKYNTEAIENNSKLGQSYKELYDTWSNAEDNVEHIRALRDEYTQLSDAINSGSLDGEELESAKQRTTDIIEEIKSLVSDDNIKLMIDTGDYETALDMAVSEAQDEADKINDAFRADYKDAQKAVSEGYSAISTYTEQAGRYNTQKQQMSEWLRAAEDYKDRYSKIMKMLDKARADESKEQRSWAKAQLNDLIHEMQDSGFTTAYRNFTGADFDFGDMDEIRGQIQNVSNAYREMGERADNMNELVNNGRESLKAMGQVALDSAMDFNGFKEIPDVFASGANAVNNVANSLKSTMQDWGFADRDIAEKIALFRNGFEDLQGAIDKGALDAVVADFVKESEKLGMTSSDIISKAALIKNGFTDVQQAATLGDISGVLKDMALLGADSVEQIDAIAHAIGLIPENKHIEINAEGNYEVLSGAAEKLHEIDNENVHISVGADGDITILNQADGTVKNLQLNGAVSLGVNADGNIDVLDEAGNKLAEIKNDPSATITVETELEEPESDVTVTTTADTDPAKAEIAKLNDEQVKVTADANTDPAKATIQALSNESVTVTVNAKVVGLPEATGTQNFPGGLAKVNDQKGISDPRELIIDRGRAFIPEGKDVILPLSKGAKVYTAAQTKAIMSGAGIPHYATGKNNSDAFTKARDDWSHYTKTHAVTTAQELEKYLEFQEKYKQNSKDIADIEEQVFSLRQKQFSEQTKASEQWLTHEIKYSGLAVTEQLDAIDRIRKSTVAAYEAGLISHKEYLDTISSYDEKYIDKRKEQIEEMFDISKGYISDHTYFNDWGDNGDGPLEAYNRVKQDRLNELAAGELTQKEYDEYMKTLGSDMYAERREQSESWLSEQRKYFNMSAEDYAAGMDRMKKYTQEYYDNGLISRREYNEAMMDLRHMELDEVASAYDEALSKQQEYISEMRDKFSKQESELRSSWEVEDRATDMATVQKQLDLYSGAVTDRGQAKYAELQEQLKKLQRDEELYNLQVANNAVIESLESDYAKMESEKKATLAGIAKNINIDVSGIVGTLTSNLNGMTGSITTLLQTLINAVNNKEINVPESTVYGPTYNDNRHITLTEQAKILRFMGSFQ